MNKFFIFLFFWFCKFLFIYLIKNNTKFLYKKFASILIYYLKTQLSFFYNKFISFLLQIIRKVLIFLCIQCLSIFKILLNKFNFILSIFYILIFLLSKIKNCRSKRIYKRIITTNTEHKRSCDIYFR